MKNITSQLQTLLNTGVFVMADLYTFTLIDGTVLRYTDFDQTLVWSGNSYPASQVLFNRTKCSWKNDLSVDALQVDAIPLPAGTVKGTSFLSACKNGVLDGATLQLDRAFLTPGSLTVTGIVTTFLGRVADIEADRLKAKLTVNSHLELLNIQMPRNLYSPGCIHVLYGATGCGLSQASFTTTGSVTGYMANPNINLNSPPYTETGTVRSLPAPTNTEIFTELSESDGFFTYGTITFTSGQNNGFQRTVESYTLLPPQETMGETISSITVAEPWPYVPAAGDSFTVTVAAVPIVNFIKTNLSQADGYFTQGIISFTSGANNGVSRTVQWHGRGNVAVGVPWPSAPAVGDTFTIAAGCDHTLATCTSKFGNQNNFRGFPYIPPAEMSY